MTEEQHSSTHTPEEVDLATGSQTREYLVDKLLRLHTRYPTARYCLEPNEYPEKVPNMTLHELHCALLRFKQIYYYFLHCRRACIKRSCAVYQAGDQQTNPDLS